MRIPTLVFCAALVTLSACATLKSTLGITTESYTATLCATGVVPIPCKTLGTVDVPTGGEALVSLVTMLAVPELTKTAKLSSCVLTAYPESVTSGGISVTASAACTFQGQAVTEMVTVTLAPTPVAA